MVLRSIKLEEGNRRAREEQDRRPRAEIKAIYEKSRRETRRGNLLLVGGPAGIVLVLVSWFVFFPAFDAPTKSR